MKKIYLKVKAQSDNFRAPLGETFTGDELFFLTIQLQELVGFDFGDEQKLFDKLCYYVEPMPK